MSKTTPVRWWRDDATRYQGRPPYVAPPEPPPPEWLVPLDMGPSPIMKLYRAMLEFYSVGGL